MLQTRSSRICLCIIGYEKVLFETEMPSFLLVLESFNRYLCSESVAALRIMDLISPTQYQARMQGVYYFFALITDTFNASQH